MFTQRAFAFVSFACVAILIAGSALAAPLPFNQTAQKSSDELPSDEVDAKWRRIAVEDITGTFAINENCREKPLINVTPVTSVRREDGVVRVTEKWCVSGCDREKSWQVNFNPDPSTGLSFFLWERRKVYAP